jgi:hypothetical protein
VELRCGSLDGRLGLGASISDDFCAQIAIRCDCPGSDDLAIPPQGGTDVAGAVEHQAGIDAE